MDPRAAARTKVEARRGFLTPAEVRRGHAFAATQRAPEQTHSRAHDGSRVVTYVSYKDAFRRELPLIYEKCRAAALAKHVAEGGRRGGRFELRVAEYHVVTVGGGLYDPTHVDAGSLVTVDVLLSDGFEGGAFTTTEAGRAASHADVFRAPGDAVLFVSAKAHHVARVESGERRVLVLEFWDGVPRGCPHRCEEPDGACEALACAEATAALKDFSDGFWDLAGDDVAAAAQAMIRVS
mmetsp:Transcript_11010/g.32856  ORF Transcript_11010/g.32856 Transcript_11010/m.32856 type:complete len:237 (+) Transcript_11010:156-866(+)